MAKVSNGTPTTNGSSKSPKTSQIYQVSEVREKFLTEHSNQKELYDENDVNKVMSSDVYIQKFMERKSGKVDDTVQMIKDSFKWRKDRGLNKVGDLSFPKEIYSMGGLFLLTEDNCLDVDGNVILYLRLKFWKKFSSEGKRLIENYMAHLMFKACEVPMEKIPAAGWIFLFDLSKTSAVNYDIPELVWIIQSLLKYYPAGLKKILIHNMPWLLKSVVTAAIAFVPSDWKHILVFTSDKDIFKYIAESNLPTVFGGTSLASIRSIPEGAKSYREMDEEDLMMKHETFEKDLSCVQKLINDET